MTPIPSIGFRLVCHTAGGISFVDLFSCIHNCFFLRALCSILSGTIKQSAFNRLQSPVQLAAHPKMPFRQISIVLRVSGLLACPKKITSTHYCRPRAEKSPGSLNRVGMTVNGIYFWASNDVGVGLSSTNPIGSMDKGETRRGTNEQCNDGNQQTKKRTYIDAPYFLPNNQLFVFQSEKI